ncbi:MAG: TIGR02646 family protein [Desulfobacterales bacterium]|nr:TIGR02646 family protein [Desulfobacterales bacterium]
MKRIVKNPEPNEFTEWKKVPRRKKNPLWSKLYGELKDMVHKALIEEQGHICCYCMNRLTEDNHIEHIRPKSTFPDKMFCYNNLLVSCQRDPEALEPRHCGTLKGNWYDENLMISPLDADCESHFRFTVDGTIRGADGNNQAAMVTIEKLGLDIDKLRRHRRDAIDGLLNGIGEPSWDEKQKLIQAYKEKDEEGRFIPFCAAIVYVLNNYF